ncbi:MAG: DUF4268 domain-containing protein [Ferruginibacter sp.]|nr:DUF4268 domain-containing protein [Ferruginibacter sp.]
MYSKQEASLLNQEFWTTLGQYMAPIPSAEGQKINWINYKTGVRHFRFLLRINDKTASVAIELSHKDPEEQEINYKKFLLLKPTLIEATGVTWHWSKLEIDEQGKLTSLVSVSQPNLVVLNKNDWPALISFFKSHLVALDKFWCEHKFVFEM